ncbi:MAG: Ig-like domain-containing protein [Heliobacteriaceae bacterium]|nr:Ig-like domain-containing protein [Heliobacteriaceae bacterium]
MKKLALFILSGLIGINILFGAVLPAAAEPPGLYFGRYYYPPDKINPALSDFARKAGGAFYVLRDGFHYLPYTEYTGADLGAITPGCRDLSVTNPLFSSYLNSQNTGQIIYTNPVAAVVTDVVNPQTVQLLGWPQKTFPFINPGDFSLRGPDGTEIPAQAIMDPFNNLVSLTLAGALNPGREYRLWFKGADTGRTVALNGTTVAISGVAATNLTNLHVSFNQAVSGVNPGDFSIRDITDPTAPPVGVTGATLAADGRSVFLVTGCRQSDHSYILIYRPGGVEPGLEAAIPGVQPVPVVVTGVKAVAANKLKVTFAAPLAENPPANDFKIYSAMDRVYLEGSPMVAPDRQTVYLTTTPHIYADYTLSYRNANGFNYQGYSDPAAVCRITAVGDANLTLFFSTPQNVTGANFTLYQNGVPVGLPAGNPVRYNTYTYTLNTGNLTSDAAYMLAFTPTGGTTNLLNFTGGGKMPAVRTAVSEGPTSVRVVFDKPFLTGQPAAGDFVISPALNIRGVRLSGDGQTVYLTTDPQVFNVKYTITHNGVIPSSPVVFTGGGEVAGVMAPIDPDDVTNTSIKISFDRLVTAAGPADFTFEPYLTVRQVLLTVNPLDPATSVATLLTSPQQPGATYRLIYRGDRTNSREFAGGAGIPAKVTQVTRSPLLGEFFITTDQVVSRTEIEGNLRYTFLDPTTGRRDMGRVEADPDPMGISGRSWRLRFVSSTGLDGITRSHPVRNTNYTLMDTATLILLNNPVLCWSGVAIIKITEDVDVGKVFVETSPPTAVGNLATAVTISGRSVRWLETGAGTARSELYIAVIDPLPVKGTVYTFNIGDGFYIDPYGDLTDVTDPLLKDQYISWPDPTVTVTPDPPGLDLQVGMTGVLTLQAEKNGVPYPGNVRYEITNAVTETATARLEGANRIRVQALKVGGFKLTIIGTATGETIIPLAIPINVFDVVPPEIIAVVLNDGAADDELGKDDSVKIDFSKPIDPVSIGLPADDPDADPRTLLEVTERAATFAEYLGRIGSFEIDTLKRNDDGTSEIRLSANRKTVVITAKGSLSTTADRERLAGKFTPNRLVTDLYGNPVMEPLPDKPIPVTGTLDRKPPVVESVNIKYHSGRPAYKIGDEVQITVSFSENVLVAEPANTALAFVDVPGVAPYTSGSGTRNLVFTFPVQEGCQTGKLAPQMFVGSTTVADESGNLLADLGLPQPASADVAIDGIRPVVSVVSATINNTKGVPAKSSERGYLYLVPVNLVVTGKQDLDNAVGNGTGRYTLVPAADVTQNVPTNGLPDGQYTVYAVDNAGNVSVKPVAVITLDSTDPAIIRVTAGVPDGYYREGQIIPITITFSEKVTGGPLNLTLNTGTVLTCPVLSTPVENATFNYQVAAGENVARLDYLAPSALVLAPGGTPLKDHADNLASLTLPNTGAPESLGGSKNLVIDTTAPVVAPGLTYLGETRVLVTFSELVDRTTAQNTANYTYKLDGTVKIPSRAVLATDGKGVELTVDLINPGMTIEVTVSGVTDLAGNPVSPTTAGYTRPAGP